MRKNKIGVVFIVSVLALTGIGVSYSGFTETLTAYGSVHTATVEFNIVDYSSTHVYKVYGGTQPPNEIYVDYADLTAAELESMFPGCTILPVSSATAAAGDDVLFTFDNLFPCINFRADVNTTIGTIPVKVQAITITPVTGANWIQPLIQSGDIHVQLIVWRNGVGTVIGEQGQVHPTDLLEIILWVHIPQQDSYQDLEGSVQVTVDVLQWNDQCDDTFDPKVLDIPDWTVGAVFYHYGPSSYWNTVISGSGLDVPDGNYVGWCVSEFEYIVPGQAYTVKLYSSYDQQFFVDHPEWNGHDWYSWPCVNYLINNKQGTIDEIQSAIWYFVNGGYTGTDPVIWAMINDALANGKYFEPQSGDNMAILVFPDPDYQHGYNVQHTFIEVDP